MRIASLFMLGKGVPGVGGAVWSVVHEEDVERRAGVE